MFREMRRTRQKLSQEEAEAILQRGTSGVLALSGDDGYPYAVPISYVYAEGKIFFHCAAAGHKIDAIRHSGKASFCVIDQDLVVPEKYTTYFRSAIAFGQIRILEDAQEKRAAMETLAVKYTPGDAEGRKKKIDLLFNVLCMLELTIEHLSGKESLELVNAKKSQ